MIQNVYSIYDRAVAVYGRPIFCAALGALMRDLRDEVNARPPASSSLSRNPQDFDVYELGTFDDSSGAFSLRSLPQLVCNCLSLRHAPVEDLFSVENAKM